MPTFHNTDGDSLGINRWVIHADEKEPDKKTCIFSLLQATIIYRVFKDPEPINEGGSKL